MGLPQKGGRRDSRAVDINKVALACSGGADSTYLAREVLAGIFFAGAFLDGVFLAGV